MLNLNVSSLNELYTHVRTYVHTYVCYFVLFNFYFILKAMQKRCQCIRVARGWWLLDLLLVLNWNQEVQEDCFVCSMNRNLFLISDFLHKSVHFLEVIKCNQVNLTMATLLIFKSKKKPNYMYIFLYNI